MYFDFWLMWVRIKNSIKNKAGNNKVKENRLNIDPTRQGYMILYLKEKTPNTGQIYLR